MKHITIDDFEQGAIEVSLAPTGLLLLDIDGTVADLSHRLPHILTKPKNYKAFENALSRDAPIAHVISHVQTLWTAGWEVVCCTGRNAHMRNETETWLAEHGIEHTGLFMRETGDYRQDVTVKSELIDRIEKTHGRPDLAFDDRDRVVAMIRARGIRCVQVAEGSY